MKAWDFLPLNITPKSTYISFITSRQYWLGIAKSKNIFRLTINPSTKLIWNFKSFLFNRIFYWQEKTRATFHWKPQPYSSMDSATDLHSRGCGFELRFFLNINTFCKYVFLEFSFDNTVTSHSRHISKRDCKIKCTSSRNLNMLIADGYLLLFVLYSTLKALV